MIDNSIKVTLYTNILEHKSFNHLVYASFERTDLHFLKIIEIVLTLVGRKKNFTICVLLQ